MTLQQEKEILTEQVKRLIRAESKLYQYQEELDAQLNEYKELYELTKKLNITFDVEEIFRHAVDHAVTNLNYERALFFRYEEDSGQFCVTALTGYYDREEKEEVAHLAIQPESLLMAFSQNHGDCVVCTPDSDAPSLHQLRALLHLNEFLLCRLVMESRPYAFLAVGNSADKADFYRRVDEGHATLVSMGNLVGLVSSSLEKSVFYRKMETALEQERLAEKKYRSIFENAVEGIYRRTLEGQYLDVNPALARMLGYRSPDQLIDQVKDIGKQLYVQPERQAEFARLLDEQGFVEGFETQLYRKDGSILWVSVSARVVRDEQGKALYYEGTAEQITERKKAEEALRESEQNYRSLFEHMLDGFCYCRMIFENGRPVDYMFLEANSACAEAWGSPDIVGKKATEVMPGIETLHPEIIEICGRVATSGISERFELCLDATQGWFDVSAYSTRRGFVALVFRNITYRKLAEQERESLIADLKRSNAELQQFAYVASHDLQEPLRTVARYVELLARRYHGRLGPDADTYISFAAEGATRMYELIKDLLDFYEIGTGPRRLEPVSMESVIAHALSNLRESIEQHDAVVTMDVMPTVTGDAGQLTQLVQNLLDNAVKFARPDVLLQVHVSAERHGDDWVFGIHDNGIGMETEYLDRIFNIFQRLHPRSAFKGTGMGLAMCRKIVEWHGGSIRAESEPGKGSTFTFTLPVRGEERHGHG